MATTKNVKETGRLTIICNSDDTCTVKTKGNMTDLTAALACLLVNDNENNQFRSMMALAMQLILTESDEKPAKKKKAAVKKK
jgi:hypothetical protein